MRFLAGIVPCLVMLVGLFFIPESPRWLVSSSLSILNCNLFSWNLKIIKILRKNLILMLQAMIGKNQEFEVALSMVRGPNVDVSRELNEILVLA